MAVSVRIKWYNLGLLVSALILRQTPLDSGEAAESTLIIQPSVGDTYVNSMHLHKVFRSASALDLKVKLYEQDSQSQTS